MRFNITAYFEHAKTITYAGVRTCERAFLRKSGRETAMNKQLILRAKEAAQFTLSAGQRYFSANEYFKKLFGEKTYKLSFDAGFGCPNRDGKVGTGGCIFCSEGGSGDFAVPIGDDINSAFELAKSKVRAKTATDSFIAYFQSYSNTYAPIETLERLYSEIIDRNDVRALSIATRPDCLEHGVYRLIARLSEKKHVFIELGLQTSNEKTAEKINRGYKLDVYDEAVKNLKRAGANVITHVIIGLPGETRNDILNTVEHVADVGSDGIKLQLLHVLKNTKLAEMYNRGEFDVLSKDEYIEILGDCVNILPENVVIHRLTGDAPKKILIAPEWSANKKDVLNSITKSFNERNVLQGSKR